MMKGIKSPDSKPTDCKSTGTKTEKQKMPSVIGGIPLFTKDLRKICFPLPYLISTSSNSIFKGE